jgi:hypothetical protein
MHCSALLLLNLWELNKHTSSIVCHFWNYPWLYSHVVSGGCHCFIMTQLMNREVKHTARELNIPKYRTPVFVLVGLIHIISVTNLKRRIYSLAPCMLHVCFTKLTWFNTRRANSYISSPMHLHSLHSWYVLKDFVCKYGIILYCVRSWSSSVSIVCD